MVDGGIWPARIRHQHRAPVDRNCDDAPEHFPNHENRFSLHYAADPRKRVKGRAMGTETETISPGG